MQSEKLILADVITITCYYYSPKTIMWCILWLGHSIKINSSIFTSAQV